MAHALSKLLADVFMKVASALVNLLMVIFMKVAATLVVKSFTNSIVG